MTRLELKQDLTWEGKIAGNTETISRLNGIISEAIIYLGQTHPELLIITPVAYPLDTLTETDFVPALGIERVELLGTAEGEEAVTIPEESKVVGPAPKSTWPKCYSISGSAAVSGQAIKGLKVSLSPPVLAGFGDQFIVWYKNIPQLLDDTHVVPDAWIPYLKQECLARIAKQRAKDEQENAKGYTVSGDQRLKAHVGTDTKSTSATN